jgi:hypothetical protein
VDSATDGICAADGVASGTAGSATDDALEGVTDDAADSAAGDVTDGDDAVSGAAAIAV